jgi:hypothetical protein
MRVSILILMWDHSNWFAGTYLKSGCKKPSQQYIFSNAPVPCEWKTTLFMMIHDGKRF